MATHNMLPQAELGEWIGEKAVWLRAGDYEAILLPESGGNLAAFRDTAQGYRFLHEPSPSHVEDFRNRPAHYGIPVLFPPNRLQDSKFPWNGKVYEFPMPSHGFLMRAPWSLAGFGSDSKSAFARIEAVVDEGHPAYEYFPHRFRLTITYTLTEEGLTQHAAVENKGDDTMPCLLGFHTSVNTPFAPESQARDYTYRCSIGSRVELSERMLPTGRLLELTERERTMAEEGIYPFNEPMDHHYTAAPVDGVNRMELTDSREGVKLVYETGASYAFWMIFNNRAQEAYFCPEPQTCMVNAPNMDLPHKETGIIPIPPGGMWEESCRLYAVKVKSQS